MTKRRPIVEVRKRGLFRRNPEEILISEEGRAEHLATVRTAELIPEEQALRSALAQFAAVVGWPEARCWLAARAHEAPARTLNRGRLAAEALFEGRVP